MLILLIYYLQSLVYNSADSKLILNTSARRILLRPCPAPASRQEAPGSGSDPVR